MNAIFKCKKHNPKKELEFELKYQQALSFQERFRMMLVQSKHILQMLVSHGHRKPTEIIKRV